MNNPVTVTFHWVLPNHSRLHLVSINLRSTVFHFDFRCSESSGHFSPEPTGKLEAVHGTGNPLEPVLLRLPPRSSIPPSPVSVYPAPSVRSSSRLCRSFAPRFPGPGLASPDKTFSLSQGSEAAIFSAHLDVEQKMPQLTKQKAKFDDILKILTLAP